LQIPDQTLLEAHKKRGKIKNYKIHLDVSHAVLGIQDVVMLATLTVANMLRGNNI
jgi:hypothetical protein